MLYIYDVLLKYFKNVVNHMAPVCSLCSLHAFIYSRIRGGGRCSPDEHAQNNAYINGVPKPAENCNVYEVPNIKSADTLPKANGRNFYS